MYKVVEYYRGAYWAEHLVTDDEEEAKRLRDELAAKDDTAEFTVERYTLDADYQS